MATFSQDKQFLNDVVGNDLLDRAMEWMRKNLTPDDVFTEKELALWAENNRYTKTV